MNRNNYVNFSQSSLGVYRDGVEIVFRDKIIHPSQADIATSVIITNFNRSEAVIEAIDSVLRCDQKKGVVEIMIVDDGSSDGSVQKIGEIAKKNGRVNLIALKDNSGSEALPKNLAAFFSKGRYISYLDSDDRMGEADAFDTSLDAIDGNPEYVMTVSNLIFEIRCTLAEVVENMPWLLEVDLYEAPESIKHPSAREYRRRIAREHSVYELLNRGYYDAFKLMRRDVFLQTGGVVEDIRSCGDFGTYLRLNRHGRALAIPRDFYTYVIHGENDSFYSPEYRRFQEEKHRAFALGEIRIRGLTFDNLKEHCQQEFWDRYKFTREEIES